MRTHLTSVYVDDQDRALAFYTEILGFEVQEGHERLRSLGVHFAHEPTDLGPATSAVLDDTCGNLIGIVHANP